MGNFLQIDTRSGGVQSIIKAKVISVLTQLFVSSPRSKESEITRHLLDMECQRCAQEAVNILLGVKQKLHIEQWKMRQRSNLGRALNASLESLRKFLAPTHASITENNLSSISS